MIYDYFLPGAKMEDSKKKVKKAKTTVYMTEGENLSIGIILCKSKKRTVVEYALKDSHKPINVASYHLVKTLPKELDKELPSPKQIAKLLENID